jgi:hypothetical protein
MKFKDLFDREILVEGEGHVRKGLKIFYEISLNLIKPKEIAPEAQPVQPTPSPETPAPEVTDTSTPPVDNTTPPVETPAPQQETPEAQPEDNSSNLDNLKKEYGEAPSEPPSSDAELKKALASVQTEEESAAEDSEEKIMRNFKGEYVCKPEQADNIQTFEDILSILADIKKEGVNVLDDFSKEVIMLCANQKFDELKTKLDKKSKIFAEIYFGYKKDDSIGVRFKKSEGSENLSSSILVDNQIVTLTKFNLERVNQKIVEYRNYEVGKKS